MANATAYLLMHEGIRVELNRLANFTEDLAAGRRHAGASQLAALRAHVVDFLDVIHHHHVGEDDHLWPLLRGVGVGVGVGGGVGIGVEHDGHDGHDGHEEHDELSRLTADHDELDALMGRLRAAVAQLAESDRGRTDAVADLAVVTGTLRELMERHLADEEAVVVPAVTTKVTDDELGQMEKRMQRSSKIKMSFVLPWLDAADPTRMAEVAAELGPVIPSLLAATRGRYRRRAAAAYGHLVVDPGPVTMCATAEVVVPASAEAVYAAAADVRRMARYSPECYRCEWLDGATDAKVGARFRGWNRFRGMRWSRECEVVTAQPGVAFAFRTVRTAARPDSTLWHFDLRPTDGGATVLTQRLELSGSPFTMWFERISGRDVSTPEAMRLTLERLRDDLSREAMRPTAAKSGMSVR